jgi:proteasome lid subunit RPN8/RPN11
MSLYIASELMEEIHAHGEASYPDEGAGLMLGTAAQGRKQVARILRLPNTRQGEARRTRYLLTPEDYMRGEDEAARHDMDVLGVFHSHPDHPERPSEYDRQWAMPWFSYLITSVHNGRAAASRSWLLSADRAAFEEEQIITQY